MHSNMIWIISLGNVPIFSIINNQEVIYPCLFAFNFLNNLLILFFNMFQPIEWKITLASDAYSRPPIIIRFHDFCASDIKGAMGEITSHHERD